MEVAMAQRDLPTIQAIKLLHMVVGTRSKKT